MATTKVTVISMKIKLLEAATRPLACLQTSLLVLGIVAIGTGALAQQAATNVAATNLAAAPQLRVSAGDLLNVDVFDSPELSAKLRVTESGDINLPVAGITHVEGMTAAEAAPAIEQRLRDKDILKNPHVEVFVQEYATQGVSVLGEVKSPGIYPNLDSHTLLDFISAAGGTTPTAGKTVSITHKDDPDNPTVVQLDNSPDLAKKADVTILPGDTVFVSRAGIVYVVGDLGKPGGFLIENNDRLTAMQAVALAQGANHTAALNRSRLIRKTPNGPQETPVELAKILSGKESDIRLEDGDILFVPMAKARAAAYQGMTYAISLATGIAIYRGF